MTDDDRRVVVIGSGPAGAIAARVLVTNGIPVTMLESGLHPPPGLLVRMMGKNIYRQRSEVPSTLHVASGDPQTLWFHAFVLGGLSNYWTGAVPRFAPEDLWEGERLHERYRWPVAYEELVPYYEYVERLFGVTGDPTDVAQLPASIVAYRRCLPRAWQPVVRAAEGYGHGLTVLPRADVRRWMITRSGAAFNSHTRVLPRLRRTAGFQLLAGAHVLQLEWSGEQRRVTSVTYLDRMTGTERRVQCAAVVVAAGALSSTKLLLDSRSPDFPEGLGNTEGVLGRYLHDHPKDWCVFELERPLPRLEHNGYLTRGRYDTAPPLLSAGYMIGNTSARDKLLSIARVHTKTFGTQIFGTVVPTEENYVRLHPERRDEFGHPLLDIHIRFTEDELRNIDAARERLLAIFDAAGYRGAIIWSMPHLSPGESVHFGGTVRMHASPRFGMLNGWNRLHAANNVVVADGSAFTTGPEKNPTPTLMALSARAAHRLADDLKTGQEALPRRSLYAASSTR